jgi:GntR family transcriptional regulator
VAVDPSIGGYRRIAAELRSAIERGEFQPGVPLPSEPALAERYGVTRPVVNRAMLMLRNEGLIRVVRGVGTFIRDLPVLTRNGRRRQEIGAAGPARGAFQAEVESHGLTARSDSTVAQVPCPASAADLLGVEPGGLVLARQRRMYANDVPAQLAISYIPLDIASGTRLEQADTGPGGMYARLGELGHGPARFAERVRVRPPTDAERSFLRLDADQPALAIRRTATDATGRIVEVNDIVLAAHQWELADDWDAI